MSNAITLPTAPDMVLRFAFAGNRNLPAQTGHIEEVLDALFECTAKRMVELKSGVLKRDDALNVHRFYSGEKPCLRIITGLAEGADSLAAEALKRLQNDRVRTELAAVLPFDAMTYRSSRDEDFRPLFDQQYNRCAYVLELDGRFGVGDANKTYRARAYRAQSMLLLRNSDLVVAVADPGATGDAGGTMETVRAALAFDLPVVFIMTDSGDVRLLEPGMDVADALEMTSSDYANSNLDWRAGLTKWIDRFVADPDVKIAHFAHTANVEAPEPEHEHGDRLLTEFFENPSVPPMDGDGKRKASWRERLWNTFEKCFQRLKSPTTEPPIEPWAAYRRRATNLNYHYSGQYRGAFVLNYVLAVLAVALAAGSLVVLGWLPQAHEKRAETKTEQTEPHTTPQPTTLATTDKIAKNPEFGEPEHGSWSWLVKLLLGLGLLKLVIVVSIYWNTHRANHGDWNDHAVDYRYLAERLRTQFYLPRVGSFQPPAAAAPQYASRQVRQSAVDWLFDAIVRSISPAKACVLVPGQMVPTIRLDAQAALEAIRQNWIGLAADEKAKVPNAGTGQIGYHQRVRDTMHRLHHFIEKSGGRLSLLVIGAVVIDLSILSGVVDWLHHLHPLTPWLIFLAALLPAAVASLNGIHFQSECDRLADRSTVMEKLLKDHADKAQELAECIKRAHGHPVTDPGAWSAVVLRLAENCARDLVEEVAEWSVLYGKDVSEV
jgi:hypothetical protein